MKMKHPVLSPEYVRRLSRACVVLCGVCFLFAVVFGGLALKMGLPLYCALAVFMFSLMGMVLMCRREDLLEHAEIARRLAAARDPEKERA